MKKCKLSSTKSLKTRSVRKKHAKDGYSKQARCNARGVKGIFVANIQPYVSYVTENSAKHASRNTFQRHVEALPLATLQLDSQLNLSPSPSPNPSPPQQLLRNAFVEKNAERKSPLQPHINARQCYFPTCYENLSENNCSMCHTCRQTYCFIHLRICLQCKSPICLSCVREEIYKRIHSAYLTGASSPANEWRHILEHGFKCVRCSTRCTLCHKVAQCDPTTCADCGNVTCGDCLIWSPSSNTFVCVTCLGRNIVRAHMAAIMLVNMQSS